MPLYEVSIPSGKKYRVNSPEPLTQDQVWQAVAEQHPEAGQPLAPPKEGIMAALTGGVKRFGSTIETGLESLIDPELAAKRGAARQEEIGQQYAPGASLEKVKQVYEQKGLFPAAYEAASQLPSAVAEQLPNMASSIGGARIGATAGSVFGPAGALVGGVGGAFAPSLMQLYGANLERQAQEKTPEISRSKAFGAAAPGAALEVASTFIPLGRNLVGKLLGPEAEKILAKGTSESIEAAAKETLAQSLKKGAIHGAVAEIPTEVTQQMLERWQAGLPLTTPDALAEYGESAYGAAMVGTPFGAVARGMGRPAARAEYAKQLQVEQLKAFKELEKQKADALRQQEEARAKTEGELGVPKMLALPAPAKEAEQEKDPLQNPVGRVTEDELGKAIGSNKVVNYIKAYRKENGLPPLKSYSIEDIKDAMTAQNPEGEEGALNAILAYKTNYQNETYTPEDIMNRAVAKNVATETKGWNDFLTRATGKADLNTMTQPELHSVASALDALKRTGKEEQLVLPEGSNAARFTQEQYNQGVTHALMDVKEGKPVTLDQAREAIKAQTDLKTDRDADHLLKTAAANEDLIVEKGTGFQAVSPGGTVLGTYGSEAEAKRKHRRADILPVETQLVRAPEEANAEKAVQLPEGYEIQKKTVAGEAVPAAYVVREDGSQTNASQTFADEADAKDRLNILTRKREANAAAEEAAADRIRKDLEKRQSKIAQMEADGQTDTAEHKNAVAAYQAANVAGSAKITEHLDKAEAFRKPLKVVPLGKKTAKVEKHTVIKQGKETGTFADRAKAEQHVLTSATEDELKAIAERGGVFGKRAETELQDRQRTEPGIKVKGTAEGLEAAGVHTPEVQAKLKELEAKLVPMLKKFGLEKVGLNVVRAIENDAEGAWGGLNNLIRIAFNATNPIKTMRHEALHALKDLGFFTDAQWEALKRQAEKTWVDKYLKGVAFNDTMSRFDAYTQMGLSNEAILEEAIADAFGDFEAAGKAPAGMLDALFKRLQQFFSSLRQALTGAGFESADDIFGKIERGELKAKVPEPSKIDTKMSLRQANYNKDANRLEVSTARPTAKRPMPGEIAPRDPVQDFYVIDSEDIMSVPSHMAAAHNAISSYNWFPISQDPDATVRAMKDTIVDNLVWLYNLTPENIRNRAKLWYNGANRIAKDWSKIYHYSTRQMAGVLAVLSPQKDWFMNTTLGERVVHVYTQQQNTAWSPEMTAWAESYVKAARDIETRDKRQVVLDAAKRLQGTKLKDMSLEDMAYFVRIYDETYHSRKYRVITPEGMFGDYVTVNEEVGEDEDEAGGQGDVAWGTYDSIQKAISIMQDGSHENISEQLGDEHKVRNFYNNIVDPDSASGSVTIDTHAVAAAAFKALSGASLEVLHNFGTTPKGLVSAGGSAMTGASGTYGFIADAYREAAAKVGVLPREMQSITWEAIRSIFPAAWKSQNAGQVNAVYNRFKDGEITLKQARDEVLKMSGGIKKFAWENDKSGVFPSAGATSFDTAKQEPRVLQPYQIREKLKINLSAAPSTDEGAEVVPGIQYLFGKARNNDMAAYTLLQEVASDNARHLLGGIENVKITTVPASGLFDDQFEPSINLAVSFDYGDKTAVLPALKRFASNFKQKQIHVRQVSKLDVETEYDDGSYNTPVFTFKLEDSFSRNEIQRIVKESGLPGITFTENQVVAYFMRGKKSDTAEEFYGQIEKLAEQLGGFVSAVDRTVERLWVYGKGFGATQGYAAIKGDVRPGRSVSVQTAKRVAAYLNNVRDNKIKTFENADITDEQANKQNAIGDMYDKLPVYDMDRPIVRKAYEALADALLEQYRALPITVSWSKKKNKKGQPVDAYSNDSNEMRKDILENNRLQILPTTPESFGPEGYDFSGHPLLEETGLTLDGRPLLYNDLLRAVHDYFAHGMTQVGFGPKGEEAAWKNHMSITKDPLARWALTMETRAQNSYVNFRSGLDRSKVPLKKRGFAMQKAALLPVGVTLTGNASVDAPMKEFIKTLSKDEKLGSAGDIKLAPGQKFSLRTYFPTAEEAENAAYQKAPPSTPEFKRFFGASKVKEEGRPQVMYHGSLNEFDQFNEDNRKGLIFVTPNPAFAEEYALLHASRMEKQEEPPVKVYPLWVRAETPFDYENPDHVAKVMNEFGGTMGMSEYTQTEKEVKEGNWAKIEDPRFVATLKKLGFDSLYVKENKTKNLAVFKANQVKSVTGNIGEFGENKSIKYSLPVIPAAAAARRDETTQAREHKGFIERITDAFKPESLADLRASFIHRYNRLGFYDQKLAEKMGGKVMLADVSAEAAANMSDLSASVTYAAFGIGNRKGGIPVYKNGMTTIDTSVRGPLEILSPLAQFNDSKAYQDYQYWAGVKRGMRYEANGKEKNFDKGDIALTEQVRQIYLSKGVDFIAIQKEMNTFNDGLVDYMKATGVLAPERAAEFKKHMDYIPFYRQLNGEDTVGPKIFNSISGVKPPKKLKGSEAPLTDYLESIVQNTQAAINAGMKNMAAQRAINVALQLGPIAGAQRLNTVSSAPDTVQVLENGKQVSYRVADQLFINAVKSLNMAEIPFMGFFSAPSNLLRNLVTKDPGFMLANLARDSLSAWITSGSNATPLIGTAANFAKALGGKDKNLHALYNAGILGGYEFSSGVIKSGEVLEKDLSKKYGSAGAAAPLKVFKGVWDALEYATEASDAATRMAVYERVLEETGNETEALYRALEVMNFNRKGSSPVVRILTAAIPFLNARVQGLDVFYRTAFGQNVSANAKEMQKAFFVRGATLMALSAAYFLAVSDDDEWKKQEQETKDNYWILPGVGKFPTPFEVGFLFKTMPERIMAYTMKDDTGQDFMQSMQRGLLNTFAFNPIPQIAKPVIEYNADYNFFTGRPIVGQGMQGVEAPYQVGPNTTKTAEALGKALGMSPLKLDQLISSYTGTMGLYAMTAIDAVLDTQSDSPHASKRFEQLPIIKRFAADPEARGNITQYYELKKAVDAAVQTENLLLKAGKAEEFADFMEKNAGLLATKQYVANVEKSMKQMREMRKMVQGAEMSADEKRDTLTAIGQAENNLNTNIQTIKKMVSEF